MQYVTRALSSFSEFYRDLNPATLSGAIDIIVVQHPDGRFSCSPFHVRFGKLQILRPQDKLVDVYVNGEMCEFKMKLGDAGEAFFVCETDITADAIPEGYITSPIVSAIASMDDSVLMDMDQLKLDGSSVAGVTPNAIALAEESANDADTMDGGRMLSFQVYSCYLDGGFYSARASDFELESLSKPLTPAIPESSAPSIDSSHLYQHHDETRQLTPIEETHLILNQSNMTTQSTDPSKRSIDQDRRVSVGTSARFIRTRTLSDVHDHADDVYGHYNATSDSELDPRYHPRPRHIATVSDAAIDLADVPHVQGPRSDTELDGLASNQLPENEWSWGWGSLPRKGLDADDLAYAHVAEANPSYADDANEWVDPVLLADKKQKEEERLKELNKAIELGPLIRIDNTSIGTPPAEIRVAMSLCGFAAIDVPDKLVANKAFRDEMVTWEKIDKDPKILADPKLIVFDGSKFYPWSFYVPLVTSYAFFGRPLSTETIQKLSEEHRPKPVAQLGKTRSRWRWWSRSEVAEPPISSEVVTAIPEKSPNVSPPVSSRSTNTAVAVPVTKSPINHASTYSVSLPPSQSGALTTQYVKSLRLTSEQLVIGNFISFPKRPRLL